jgi:molecular chaperone DnaK
MALQRLREAAEKAKMELSTVMETDINLPFISADATGPKHLQMKLTRAKFEQLVDDLLQKTVGPTKQALADAGVDPSKIDEVVLVGGSTRIPKVQQIVKDLFGKEPHKGVNPDEVVALGAAIQAGVLAGEVKDPAAPRRDAAVARHRDAGRRDDALIQRNTTIPTRKSETFSTAGRQSDERRGARAAGRTAAGARQPHLGRFQLVGIPPAPRGVPQIEVTFDIDANGIVNVSAKDQGTGKEQKITITASSGLSKDEVDRMMKDAESHAEEDKKRREEIETRKPRRPGSVCGRKVRPGVGRQARLREGGGGKRHRIAQERARSQRHGGDDKRDGAADAGAAQGRRDALQAGRTGAGRRWTGCERSVGRAGRHRCSGWRRRRRDRRGSRRRQTVTTVEHDTR